MAIRRTNKCILISLQAEQVGGFQFCFSAPGNAGGADAADCAGGAHCPWRSWSSCAATDGVSVAESTGQLPWGSAQRRDAARGQDCARNSCRLPADASCQLGSACVQMGQAAVQTAHPEIFFELRFVEPYTTAHLQSRTRPAGREVLVGRNVQGSHSRCRWDRAALQQKRRHTGHIPFRLSGLVRVRLQGLLGMLGLLR